MSVELVERARVRAVFASGVEAFETVATRVPDDAWVRRACGVWSAADLARHVLSVAGWFHSWLDRALAGDSSVPFPVERMDQETARSVSAVSEVSEAEAVTRFGVEARRYLDRLTDDVWTIPFGYPRGEVTPGLHAGLAALEWHVHAWDLSSVTDVRHVPDDPAALFLAAADCRAATAGSFEARAMRRGAQMAVKRDPWGQVLSRSGRRLDP